MQPARLAEVARNLAEVSRLSLLLPLHKEFHVLTSYIRSAVRRQLRGIVDMDDALDMVQDTAHRLARKAYKLEG